MPNTKSAIKAMHQSLRRRVFNLRTKEKFKDAVRAFRKLIAAGKRSDAANAMKKAMSALDKAVKKGQLHRNASARLKSRMSAALAKLKV